MKLYTEENVIELTKSAFTAGQNHNSFIFQAELKNITPIELPSDEEIDAMGKDVIIYNDTKRGWFIEGLKWMRDKIQGGNNEQQ